MLAAAVVEARVTRSYGSQRPRAEVQAITGHIVRRGDFVEAGVARIGTFQEWPK